MKEDIQANQKNLGRQSHKNQHQNIYLIQILGYLSQGFAFARLKQTFAFLSKARLRQRDTSADIINEFCDMYCTDQSAINLKCCRH